MAITIQEQGVDIAKGLVANARAVEAALMADRDYCFKMQKQKMGDYTFYTGRIAGTLGISALWDVKPANEAKQEAAAWEARALDIAGKIPNATNFVVTRGNQYALIRDNSELVIQALIAQVGGEQDLDKVAKTLASNVNPLVAKLTQDIRAKKIQYTTIAGKVVGDV